MSLHQHGRTRQLADLSVFEGPHNPDGKTVYSVRDAAVVALGADMDMTIHLCMLGHRYYAQAVRTVITVSGEWLYYTVLHYTVLPAAMASGVAVSGHTLAALTNVLADPGGSLVTMRLRQLGFAGVGPVLS
ncbi:hypothetical protein [Arthrobacter sp. ERGS1:01]|uniref:hypothetical protein n=1 Tax=Arthrobacter sp. ERGS1:01 TaxID=1704044 RepID=UPI0012378C2E|nr:hypothetical protein [Arthrobacter sp. ERGS1:01]